MDPLRSSTSLGARVALPPRRLIPLALLLLLACCGAVWLPTAVATAPKRAEGALREEGLVQGAGSREVFSWIDGLLRTPPVTVTKIEASVGASFHRIERNDWFSVYETSGPGRPWVRRAELRLPERANQGWSSFLILELEPARVEILPVDAMAHRSGARVGANPVIPPGWRGIWKYWELAAPDFLLWDDTDQTIVFRFRSEGPRRLQQCSFYRKAAGSRADGPEAHRVAKPGRLKVETGLGSRIDALLDESPEAAARVQALQRAGWRVSWAPLMVSAIDFVQKSLLVLHDKDPEKSYAWLLWELDQLPQPLDAITLTRSTE